MREWADDAAAGFFLFALGTSCKSENIPEQVRLAFVDAFKKFPKLKFAWKWDGKPMLDLSQNVRLERWLPQNDLLGTNTLPMIKIINFYFL